MLPSGAKDQSTAFQIVFYTLWTVVISLIPTFRYTGMLYLSQNAAFLVLILGFMFLYFSIKLMVSKTDKAARTLIRASIIYLTGVQILYVIDKFLFQ